MARKFNGSSDQIVTDSTNIQYSILKRGCVTLTAWLNSAGSSPSSYGGLIGYSDGGAHFINIFAKNDLNVAYYVGNGTTVSIDPGALQYVTGTWIHHAVTYDNGSGNLVGYLGGKVCGTASSAGRLPNSSGTNFRIGADAYSNRNINGTIADAAVWLSVLSPAEILSLARATLRPFQIRLASLIGYWPLDGYGAAALDFGFGRHNGVLTGTSLAAEPPLLARRKFFDQQKNTFMPPTFVWPKRVTVTAPKIRYYYDMNRSQHV